MVQDLLNVKLFKKIGKLGQAIGIIGKPFINEFLEAHFIIFRLKMGEKLNFE
jgi:hypothetical protein